MTDGAPPAQDALAQSRRGLAHWLLHRLRHVGAVLHQAVREHSLLVGLITLHLAAAAAMPTLLGQHLSFPFSFLSTAQLLAMLGLWVMLIAVSLDAIAAAIRSPDGRPLASAWRRIADHHLRADRIVGGLMVMTLLPLFTVSFGFLQALIPLLHRLDWDPDFAAFDRWLHFGRAPWEWLQPVFGHPLATSILSAAYASWFFALYGVMIWQAFTRRDALLRMQYFLTSILIWMLLGNVAGTLLASGGPVYYGRITGEADPFAPLFSYLQAASREWPNFTLGVQERLWQVYLTNGRDGVVNGAVMAMPSLHVATAFSFYLVGRRVHPALGLLFGLFTLVILIATVHLGWHYAIDGYAGILGTLAIWWGSGKLLRWPPLGRWLWGARFIELTRVGAARGDRV